MPRIPKFDKSRLRQSLRVGVADNSTAIDSARMQGRAGQAIAKGVADVAQTVDKYAKAGENRAYFAAVDKYKSERERIENETLRDWDPSQDASFELTLDEKLVGLRASMTEDISKSGRLSKGLETSLNGMDELFLSKAATYETTERFKHNLKEIGKRSQNEAARWDFLTTKSEMLQGISTINAELESQNEVYEFKEGELKRAQDFEKKNMMVTHFQKLAKSVGGSQRGLSIVNGKDAQSVDLMKAFTPDEAQAWRKKFDGSIKTGLKINKSAIGDSIAVAKQNADAGVPLSDSDFSALKSSIRSAWSGQKDSITKRIRDVETNQRAAKFVQLLKSDTQAEMFEEKNKVMKGITDPVEKRMFEQRVANIEKSEFTNRETMGKQIVDERMNNDNAITQNLAFQRFEGARLSMKENPGDQLAAQLYIESARDFQKALNANKDIQRDLFKIRNVRVTSDMEAYTMIEGAMSLKDNPAELAEFMQSRHELYGDMFGQAAWEMNSLDKDGFSADMAIAAYIPTQQGKEKYFRETVGWDGPQGIKNTIFGDGKTIDGKSYKQVLDSAREVVAKELSNITAINSPQRTRFQDALAHYVAKRSSMDFFNGKITDLDAGFMNDMQDYLEEGFVKDTFIVGKGGKHKYIAPKVLAYNGSEPINLNQEWLEEAVEMLSSPQAIASMGFRAPQDAIDTMKDLHLRSADETSLVIAQRHPVEFWTDNRDNSGIIPFYIDGEGDKVPYMRQRIGEDGKPMWEKNVRGETFAVMEPIEISYNDIHTLTTEMQAAKDEAFRNSVTGPSSTLTGIQMIQKSRKMGRKKLKELIKRERGLEEAPEVRLR